MEGFDKHLQKILATSPDATLAHTKIFSELPLSTQLAVMRRRRSLSQRDLAQKMKVLQPHVARTESSHHDPRISSIIKAAKAIRCHVMLIPDENFKQVAALI